MNFDGFNELPSHIASIYPCGIYISEQQLLQLSNGLDRKGAGAEKGSEMW